MIDHTQIRPELYNLPFRTDRFHGMPYRYLGRSGMQASAVGLGTWKMGFPETGDGSRIDENASFEIFDRAIELGVTLWDTANRYNDGSGNSERIIGRWFKANPGQRRNVVLATKIFGGMDGLTPNHSGLSRTNVLDAVYASLSRLQLDYVDILYFHRYDPIAPVEESLDAIDDLIRRDMVRYLAVSNFDVDQLRLYQVATESRIRCRPLAVQNAFDLLHGEYNNPNVLEHCAREGISFIAWSPLGRGLLTERYLDPRRVGAGDRLFDEGALEKEATPEVMEKLHRLANLAREWGIPLNQLALAYMLTLPGMGPVIPTSSNVAQLESNAAAGRLTLDEEQRLSIRQALQGQ